MKSTAFKQTLPAALSCGFAVAVAMWAVGFVTHLPGVDAPAWVVGVLMLTVQCLGGVAVGRSTGMLPVFQVGGVAGFITALVNTLILGSVLSDPSQTNALKPEAIPLLLSYIAASALVGAVTALAGRAVRRVPGADRSALDWLACFPRVAACSALLVIVSGGIVTGKGAGLAVPDWPTSFSANMFLFPLSKMSGGIYYEHAHRLFGSLAGFTVLTLLAFTLSAERRSWAKLLVGAVFLMVCVQGVLGGLRVDQTSVPLAMLHGILGQVTFAALLACAAGLSTGFRAASPAVAGASDGFLRAAAPVLLLVLFIQLALGAATRHFHHAHALYSHLGFSLIAAVVAMMVAFRAIVRHKDAPPLPRLGHAVLHTTLLQIVLGFATFLTVLPYSDQARSSLAVIVSTAHQANGALLLGCAVMLLAWTRRIIPR